jgi:hypothetical protein
MTLRIPRDFTQLLQFRKMEELLGDRHRATLLFIALWTHLGYEVESTGAAGFMADIDEFIFQRILPGQIDAPMRVLEASGFLKKVPGGWECLLFCHYNAQLDANWIPDETDDAWRKFIDGKTAMAKETPLILESIPNQSWFLEKTGKVEDAMMKKAILLVKMIDGILKVGKRAPAEFEPPLIGAAISVIQEWTDIQISVILRRAYEVSRRKTLPPGFTRSTMVFLERFEDVVALLLPAEGYIKWSKRVTHRDLTE